MSNKNSINPSDLHPIHRDRLIRYYTDNGAERLSNWVSDNLISYYIDNGEVIEDYCNPVINNLLKSFLRLDINVNMRDVYCMWCDWSRRFDAGWLSEKDNSNKEYDECRDFYLKKVKN